MIAGNLAGAAFAGYLLLPNLRFFAQTGRLIGLVSWQLVRIHVEERHLEGPQYAAYRRRVRWRLCPGLW